MDAQCPCSKKHKRNDGTAQNAEQEANIEEQASDHAEAKGTVDGEASNGAGGGEPSAPVAPVHPVVPLVARRRRINCNHRDLLLAKEISELKESLPTQCEVKWADENKLHEFSLCVEPEEGHWQSGKFLFAVVIPETYNMSPPQVRCTTKIWHPNINEKGDICLSILREVLNDAHGWTPTRALKDVIWGINSLFTDLVNFDDPLNSEAACEYKKDPAMFKRTVKRYINEHCPREGKGAHHRGGHDEDY